MVRLFSFPKKRTTTITIWKIDVFDVLNEWPLEIKSLLLLILLLIIIPTQLIRKNNFMFNESLNC